MEDFLQVLGMFLSSFSFDHYVINVYFHRATNQGLEDFYHQSLVGGANVFESEQHNFVSIKSMRRYKESFFFVCLGHRDMMVSGEGI